MVADPGNPDDVESVESILDRWYELFSQRLIAFCGGYKTLDTQGNLTETFFCYTGFLVEVNECWYMLTAGHCLEQFYKALENPQIEITGVALVGGFGPVSNGVIAVPFHRYDTAPRNFVHDIDNGLDYGWIEVSLFYRKMLESGQASTLPMSDITIPTKGHIQGHVIVGFPDELVEKNLNQGNGDDPIRGEIEPVMISSNEIANPDPDIVRHKAKWFVGQLPSSSISLERANGLSGGPIIEIASDGDVFSFRMIAIQSWWIDQRRIVFGCPANVFLPKVLAEIEASQHASPG